MAADGSRGSKRQTSGVDQVIGLRLRSVRLQAGWSQFELAEKLNVSFQQVQKYEKATNRVSAASLWQIAQLFDVPMDFFFDEVVASSMSAGLSEDVTVHDRSEGSLLTRYRRVSPKVRASILGLLSAAAAIEDETAG